MMTLESTRKPSPRITVSTLESERNYHQLCAWVAVGLNEGLERQRIELALTKDEPPALNVERWVGGVMPWDCWRFV
jgi:hypothetical protein